jgi:hypothetical protein
VFLALTDASERSRFIADYRTLDELHQFSTAMLAEVFAVVMLVVGQLYIERASSRELQGEGVLYEGAAALIGARFGELTADRSEMLQARERRPAS